jgi:hypothetical protein
MTPEQYLAQLRALMAAGRYQDALDYAGAVQDTLSPPLSIEQRWGVEGTLEMAATAVQMEAENRAAVESARTAPRP